MKNIKRVTTFLGSVILGLQLFFFMSIWNSGCSRESVHAQSVENIITVLGEQNGYDKFVSWVDLHLSKERLARNPNWITSCKGAKNTAIPLFDTDFDWRLIGLYPGFPGVVLVYFDENGEMESALFGASRYGVVVSIGRNKVVHYNNVVYRKNRLIVYSLGE